LGCRSCLAVQADSELAEAMAELLGEAVRSEFKFHHRVELDKNASLQFKQNVNSTLDRILPNLSFYKDE
jgi:hypothetical protein